MLTAQGIRYVYGHCQSSAKRGNDPGPEIWASVGQWAIDTLGMSEGGPDYSLGTRTRRSWDGKRAVLLALVRKSVPLWAGAHLHACLRLKTGRDARYHGSVQSVSCWLPPPRAAGRTRMPSTWKLTHALVSLLVLVGCEERDGSEGSLMVGDGQGCAEGLVLDFDGCTEQDPTKTVFGVDADEINMESDDTTAPGNGAGSDGLAEACCIFAVRPDGIIFQGPYGEFVFTGACPLPYPWGPGAYGCGCIGNNVIIDPFTGQWGTLYGSWIGFTCLVN